jgi:hypothetical protein
MVDVVLGKRLVQPDTEEIEHGTRPWAEMREARTKEIGIGVARCVWHGVLTQHGFGVASPAIPQRKCSEDVTVDHRSRLQLAKKYSECRPRSAAPRRNHLMYMVGEGWDRKTDGTSHSRRTTRPPA